LSSEGGYGVLKICSPEKECHAKKDSRPYILDTEIRRMTIPKMKNNTGYDLSLRKNR